MFGESYDVRYFKISSNHILKTQCFLVLLKIHLKLFYLGASVCVGMSAHKCSAHRGQMKASDALELELKAAVGCLKLFLAQALQKSN